MEELDIKIGHKLKKVREDLGYTMREVGERTGIHFTYIGKIEKGQIPSLDKLNKLCELYKINITSLFGEEIEIPGELRELGIEWITFAKEMKRENLTPEEIKNIVSVIKSLNLKK
jgi:transcriptional regulator with XRE-family HTH domain